MKNNKRRTGIQKDKLFMIAASVFILTAFTMTGVYVADSNKQEQDGYLIDFSELEGQAKNENKTIDKAQEEKKKTQEKPAAKVNSGKVENPDRKLIKENTGKEIRQEVVANKEEDSTQQEAVMTPAKDQAGQAKVHSFSAQDTLAWPVVGSVLLDYSMDKAIYYQTMQQYRYNPAVVIAAGEDEPITAAADARVISVFQDAEIGKGVIFDLGDGYELTYGQLKGITVKEGDDIQKGDLIGYIDKPTIYYSEEGSNLYVKLTKDGVPIDPLQNMQETE